MILTRISRQISRSSSFKRNVRGLISNESISVNDFDRGEGLGFLRSYLTSISSNGGVNLFSKNLGLRRLFCNEAPKKKNYENYYPKEKRVPVKMGAQNSGSGSGSSSSSGSKGDSGKNEDGESFKKYFQNFISPLFFFGFVLSSIFLTPQEDKEISFQEFKNKLLEPGLVDHIVVTNKSVAKVYVKNTIPSGDEVFQGPNSGNGSRRNGSFYKYYFTIGSLETFKKLKEAQEALGIDPHKYVPVSYSSQTNWVQEVMRFAPTLLLLGTMYFLSQRMQGGSGGMGPRGIFSIGKAKVTKLDKNSKNKEI